MNPAPPSTAAIAAAATARCSPRTCSASASDPPRHLGALRGRAARHPRDRWHRIRCWSTTPTARAIPLFGHRDRQRLRPRQRDVSERVAGLPPVALPRYREPVQQFLTHQQSRPHALPDLRGRACMAGPVTGFYYDASLFQVNVKRPHRVAELSARPKPSTSTPATRAAAAWSWSHPMTCCASRRMRSRTRHLDVFANASLLDARSPAASFPARPARRRPMRRDYVLKAGITLRRDHSTR